MRKTIRRPHQGCLVGNRAGLMPGKVPSIDPESAEPIQSAKPPGATMLTDRSLRAREKTV
jgi:hypothetical protein